MAGPGKRFDVKATLPISQDSRELTKVSEAYKNLKPRFFRTGLEISKSERQRFILNRVVDPAFPDMLWERSWFYKGADLRAKIEELDAVRAYSGAGILEPHTILVSRTAVQTVSAAEGFTLAELDANRELRKSEQFTREFLEQLLVALLRIHKGLGRPHGALFPYNIELTSERKVRLWSVPTAHLEARFTPENEKHPRWDRPYLKYDGSPIRDTIKGDLMRVASLFGNLKFYPLSFPHQALYCDDIVEFAKLVDPDTRLPDFSLEKSIVHQATALQLYRAGNRKAAQELWQEALKGDWLSTAVWNNLAVIDVLDARWGEARDKLNNALQVAGSHHVVLANLAHLHLAEKSDLETARAYAAQAVAMRPDLASYRLLSAEIEMALGQSKSAKLHLEDALRAEGQVPDFKHRIERISNQDTWLKVPEPYILDERQDPPWGKVRRVSPPDEPDDGVDGSGVPRNPKPTPRQGISRKPTPGKGLSPKPGFRPPK